MFGIHHANGDQSSTVISRLGPEINIIQSFYYVIIEVIPPP
jgi:hypothetical protein